jgi:hypothetical protein
VERKTCSLRVGFEPAFDATERVGDMFEILIERMG